MLNCPVAAAPLVGAMVTPGVSWRRVLKLRPFKGKLSTNLRSMTVLTAADSVFTSGAPPSTVTISCSPPTGRVKFMESASATLRMMSGLMIVLKPTLET